MAINSQSRLARSVSWSLCALALTFGVAGHSWAGFDEGVAAYNRGDYATALKEFRAEAGKGNALAQFNLGLM